MSVRGIHRGPVAVGKASGSNAPIYVDSNDSNKLKTIVGGAGDTTEVEIPTNASGFARAPVAGGSSLTLTAGTHGDKTIALDTAAGTTITLPAATGSGVKFRFVVTVTPTSNQHRINVVGNDAFFGAIFGAQDGGATVEAWEAAADSDQINLNGTTLGGIKGDWIEIEDMVADGWSVRGLISQTGVQATPFATGQVA